jgi:peptidoglycan/LPS O-acetylase OafA/YrhL
LAPLLRAFVHVGDPGDIYVLTPFRMDLLATGGLLALMWREKPLWIQQVGPVAGPSLFLLGVAGFRWLQHRGINDTSPVPLGYALIFESSLILWLGIMVYALSGWHVEWLRTRPLRFLGKISYSMYLVHFLFLTLLRGLVHRNQLTVVAALVLTIIYASLSWFLMEKPLLRRKSRASGQEPLPEPIGIGAI